MVGYGVLQLQQHLPFTVLKLWGYFIPLYFIYSVATALTVYGIETANKRLLQHGEAYVGCNSTYRLRYWNLQETYISYSSFHSVATALTVYGIETNFCALFMEEKIMNVATALTVYGIETEPKLFLIERISSRCNSTYRLRYWNTTMCYMCQRVLFSCNSTYRLRYWNCSK